MPPSRPSLSSAELTQARLLLNGTMASYPSVIEAAMHDSFPHMPQGRYSDREQERWQRYFKWEDQNRVQQHSQTHSPSSTHNSHPQSTSTSSNHHRPRNENTIAGFLEYASHLPRPSTKDLARMDQHSGGAGSMSNAYLAPPAPSYSSPYASSPPPYTSHPSPYEETPESSRHGHGHHRQGHERSRNGNRDRRGHAEKSEAEAEAWAQEWKSTFGYYPAETDIERYRRGS